MDRYNDAVQNPQSAFSDPDLKASKIVTNTMGLPIALGGGFALTYKAVANGRKLAIRCFHKDASGLQVRYSHISKGLREAGGEYFVGFDYQPNGIFVGGSSFPIVKMDWADGDTLGSFVEDNYSDKSRIKTLRLDFAALEQFLRIKGLAHGDIQNGNVLVGQGIRLIDYDGIYVPGLQTGKGTEVGHKHFQHPRRSALDFGPNMDRFSSIVIDLSLRSLEHDPKLFGKYSNGENILFTANDYVDPQNSALFNDLKAIPALARDTVNFATICFASPLETPVLADFLAGKSIPTAPPVIGASVAKAQGKQKAAYIGAYDVLDATSFSLIQENVGNRVEVVGKVAKVYSAKTKYGRPYIFVFFGNSQQSFRLNFWSTGLKTLTDTPSQAWVGLWLSVQGLVDPPYSSGRGTSLSITISSKAQFRRITETEALHRLAKPEGGQPVQSPPDNRAIVEALGPGTRTRSSGPRPSPPPPTRPKAPTIPQSANQAILNTIRQVPSRPTQRSVLPPSPPHHSARPVAPSIQRNGRRTPWKWIMLGVGVLFLLIRLLFK